MSSLNKVILIGRLTADPELRYVGNSVAQTTFTLAVDRPYQGRNGERQTDFIPVKVWRNKAETVSKYTAKGDMVAIEGRLEIDERESQDGKKVKYTQVVADNVIFLSTKRKQESKQPSQEKAEQHQDVSYPIVPPDFDPFANSGMPIDVSEDDLPF